MSSCRLVFGAAALTLAAGCEASSRTKSEVESSLDQAIAQAFAPQKVDCKAVHDDAKPQELRVRCGAPGMSSVMVANRTKDVLVKNCTAIKRADFSKINIDVLRDGGGTHTLWGKVGDACDDWLALDGLQ